MGCGIKAECLNSTSQYNINDRKIDLYIPQYKIAIECNEYGHINYDPNDEKLKLNEILINGIEAFCYNPNKKNFDIDIVIKKLQTVIDRKKLSTMKLDDLIELLREYNTNSLEGQYYESFGQSLITNGFVVDFDNVWKMCKFSRKIHAKKVLINNFLEDIDYNLASNSIKPLKKQNGRPMEKIMITGECFKMFCMTAQTKEAKEIRKWYIKMEINYKNILLTTISILQSERTIVLDAVKNKTIEKKHEVNLKKIEYKKNIHAEIKDENSELCEETNDIKSTKKESQLISILNIVLYANDHTEIKNITDFKTTSIEINKYDYNDAFDDILDDIKDEYGINTIRYYDRKRIDIYILTLIKTMSVALGYKLISKRQSKKIKEPLKYM